MNAGMLQVFKNIPPSHSTKTKLRLEPNCDRITCHMLLKNRPLIWRCRRGLCASSQPNPNHTTVLDLGKNGATGSGTALSGAQVQLATLNSLRLLDNLLALSKDQLDVTWVRHVWVDLKLLVVAFVLACDSNLRVREHGMCGDAALVPG